MKRTIVFAAAATAVLMLPHGAPVQLVPEAQAQQMGNTPYNFSRNPSLAAQFQYGRSSASSSSASNGLGALHQYVTTYNSSSTSIGNLNEVNQILSGGSQGSVGQSTHQASQGNQGSEATTETSVDSSVEVHNSTSSAENASSGN